MERPRTIARASIGHACVFGQVIPFPQHMQCDGKERFYPRLGIITIIFGRKILFLIQGIEVKICYSCVYEPSQTCLANSHFTSLVQKYTIFQLSENFEGKLRVFLFE